MTKSKAIKILEEFINYKQNCVESINRDKFKTDVEDIRKSLATLHERDKKILESILFQIKSTKKDVKDIEKSAKEDLLSLEVKREIARQIKLGIANYKKEKSEKVIVHGSKRNVKS